MKNTKRNVLTLILSFALIMCLALSVGLSVKPVSAATGTLTTFEVVEGAAIRRGTVDPETEEEINNGIRFASKVSITEFNALDGENTLVKVGMFIMPYDYIERFGEINEDNCFGVSAGYTWTDKETASKDGAKQIIHLKSSAFIPTLESGALADYYLIQGSVVNMKEQNLDREYVGCAYISVEKEGATTYYFAKGYAQNKRSPIDVSYNALLKSDFEDVHEIAEEYVTDYIAYYKSQNDGANPTRTINADVYLNSSTGEYVKSASKSTVKTVEIATVEDLTKDYTVEDLGIQESGYYYISQKSASTATTKLKLDNSASVSYYYDYQSVDVLFDGATGAQTVDGGTVSGLKSSWGFTNITPKSYHGIKTNALCAYDHTALGGNYIITFDSAIQLSETTADFSFMTRMLEANKFVDVHGQHVTSSTLPINIWIYTDDNAYQLADLTSITYSNTSYDENDRLWASEWQQVNFSLPNAISQVKQIYMTFTNTLNDAGYAFDFFCAEHKGFNFEIGGENTTVNGNVIKVSGNSPVTFNIVKSNMSTVYSEEELATLKTTVVAKKYVHGDYYSVGGTGETTDLTETESGYSLSAIENYYTVATQVTINGENFGTSNKYTVLGYFPNMIEDFSTDVLSTSMCTSKVNYSYYAKDGIAGEGGVWSQNNAQGRMVVDYSLGTGTSKTLTKDCNTVSMWFMPYYFRQGNENHPSGLYKWPYGLVGVFGYENTTGVEFISATNYDYVYIEYQLNGTIKAGTPENQELKLYGPPTGVQSGGTYTGSLFGCYYDNIALK